MPSVRLSLPALKTWTCCKCGLKQCYAAYRPPEGRTLDDGRWECANCVAGKPRQRLEPVVPFTSKVEAYMQAHPRRSFRMHDLAGLLKVFPRQVGKALQTPWDQRRVRRLRKGLYRAPMARKE